MRISTSPATASNVPNPLRQNYDYSNEMGGPEWQNRVKTYMKRRKKRMAALESMFMVRRASREIRVGDDFSWRTLGGKSYSGTVKEIDNETVMVSCSDGVVRCTSLTLSEMGRDEMGNKKES